MYRSLLLFLCSLILFAEQIDTFSLPINGTTLNQSCQIYLPYGKEDKKKTYPVLYILDGQYFFKNGVAIQNGLQITDVFPEMIVVGLTTTRDVRNQLYFSKRKAFTEFIEKQLIPYVETNYHASDDRLLFGWENGAFYSSYILFEKSELFRCVISSNGAELSEERIKNFASKKLPFKPYFFFTNTDRDIYTYRFSESLYKALKTHQPKNLHWTYKKRNDEYHGSLPIVALYDGLRYYYQNFPELEFRSIDEFNRMGGLNFLAQYYKERGSRFGFSQEISDGSKNNLIFIAWITNNYPSFKFFMNEFKDVLQTKRYASSYWQNRLGQFYLKHKNSDKAIEFFKNGLEKYTVTPMLYNGLGKAYLLKKNMKAGLKYLEKAVTLGTQEKDGHLKTFISDLTEARKRYTDLN